METVVCFNFPVFAHDGIAALGQAQVSLRNSFQFQLWMGTQLSDRPKCFSEIVSSFLSGRHRSSWRDPSASQKCPEAALENVYVLVWLTTDRSLTFLGGTSAKSFVHSSHHQQIFYCDNLVYVCNA